MEHCTQLDGAKLIVEMLIKNSIIPIFGAGFTYNCKAAGGKVPDGQLTKELMQKLIVKNSKFTDSDLQSFNFNKMSEYFSVVPKPQKNVFLEDNFTQVELEDYKKRFLELPWKYAYTLNVDDGIERTGLFKEILPYINLKKDLSLVHNKQIFKLHGDAYCEIFYESESIVFSSNQYIKALKDDNNKDIYNNLKSDYSSFNILFIGCSLSNEPDLEFLVSDIKEFSNEANRITLLTKHPNPIEEFELEKYAINKYILIEDFEQFYIQICNFFQSMCKETEKYKYINPSVINYNDKKRSCYYLSRNNIFNPKNNEFTTGGMHIKRTCLTSILTALKDNHFVFVQGRRFSGKTYLLASLCNQMKSKNIIYFPSDSLIDYITVKSLFEEKNNTVFIFDTNSISAETRRIIKDIKDLIKEKNNKAVIAINSNDTHFLDFLGAELIELPNRFDEEELIDIGKAANKYGLSKRNKRDTNLDYLMTLKKHLEFKEMSLPKTSVNLSPADYTIIILLAAFDKVYDADIYALNIAPREVNLFVNKFSYVFEYIQTDSTESRNHSRKKIVHNSKLFLLELIRLMDNKSISDCICSIVEKLRYDRKRKWTYINLIKFNTLNEIFGKKLGAGNLIYSVYDLLEQYLKENADYWLQRAKSIYRRFPEDEGKVIKAYDYALKAYNDYKDERKDSIALSLAIVSALYMQFIDEDEYEDKLYYAVQAVEKAYDAVNWQGYRYYVNEFKHRRNKSDVYTLINYSCNYVIDKTDDEDSYNKSLKLQRRIKQLKDEAQKKQRY